MRFPRAGPPMADPLGQWAPAVISTVLASMSVYLSSWGTYDKFTDSLATYWDYEGDTFDFIVVGGGSAGGVVAKRLAAHYKVLLIEAGGQINPFQTIPAMSLLMLNYPEIDWKWKTVAQKHSCYALPKNKSHWSQGKGLGGTSNLNFLIQSRGNPRDFDNWADLTGDEGWSYEGVLPYFMKSEDYYGRWENDGTHGRNGELRIALPEYTGMADLYVRAAKELGYPRADLNGYFTEGFDTIYYPIKDGRRYGIFAAFIQPSNPNLIVRKYSTVRKVLIDDDNRAYGVEYEQHGKPEVAYAKKEIVISAGAMVSPKILLLSGIGPKDELEDIGIEVRQNLPVGRNLQDHISAYLGPFFVNQPISFNIDRDVTSVNIAKFFAQGTGILTTSGTQAMGFIASSNAKKAGEGDWPDIQLILAGVSVGESFAKDFARGFGPKKKVLERYYKHAVGKDSFLQIVSLGRPHARGYIKLNNTHPHEAAIIDPSYLDNKHDIEVLVEGVKRAVELIEKTKVFKAMDGQFTDRVFPGCEGMEFRSDAYWECYVRSFAITLHHIVGSCSMGKNDSKDAVVDTELRVIGIQGLRVVDASIMPVVVVGNTNAPTVMIGEKGADMILKAWEWERIELDNLNKERERNATTTEPPYEEDPYDPGYPQKVLKDNGLHPKLNETAVKNHTVLNLFNQSDKN